MNTAWFKDLNDEKAKADLEDSIKRSHAVCTRILEILEDQEDRLNRQETTVNDYSNHSWAYLQADRNGYRRHIREMRSLFSHLKG